MARQTEQPSEQARERSLRLFEDRYGAGAHARLITLLAQPCLTFAQIGHQFGVSRERVRQWQLEFLPDAPRGHQRRRLCLVQQQRRKLLEDPLFRSFYRHARSEFDVRDLVPIDARNGFRKRAVRLNGYVIAIKSATPIPRSSASAGPSYVLTGSVAAVDFIYYRLTDADYLVVPRALVPPAGTSFQDTTLSRCYPYRNSFAAVRATATAHQQAS